MGSLFSTPRGFPLSLHPICLLSWPTPLPGIQRSCEFPVCHHQARMERKTELDGRRRGGSNYQPRPRTVYAARAGSQTIEVAGASHSVFISHPEEVAGVIEGAARAPSVMSTARKLGSE